MSYLPCIVIVSVFSIIYLLSEKLINRLFNSKPIGVTYENATASLEKISSWAMWLTSLQTAAMAAMALLIKDTNQLGTSKDYGFFALLFFGASIILSTWLLSGIPSVQQRLINSVKPETENDIYVMRIFRVTRITLGHLSGLIHFYFFVGIIFFTLFIFSRF